MSKHRGSFEHWLWNWRIAKKSRSTMELRVKTANRIQRAPASTLLRGANKSGSIQLHIRVPSTWSTRIIQVGKKAGQKPSVLDPLLKGSGLSIRRSVLEPSNPTAEAISQHNKKYFIQNSSSVLMDYARPNCWSASARTHVSSYCE
jgi:hypothetical protein